MLRHLPQRWSHLGKIVVNALDAFDRILALRHRAVIDAVYWPPATAMVAEADGI